eukprot:1161793-Pelagomonas_calceolata.AAC.6
MATGSARPALFHDKSAFFKSDASGNVGVGIQKPLHALEVGGMVHGSSGSIAPMSRAQGHP